MPRTNFEKWTESPKALLDAMRTIGRYSTLIEMGLVDFDAWSESDSDTPVWCDPRPATYHDKPHGRERPCVLIDTSERRWGEPYAIIFDERSQTAMKVPMRNVTVLETEE